MAIGLVLLYFAIVFAFLAAVFLEGVERPPIAIRFGWLALAFYLLSLVIK